MSNSPIPETSLPTAPPPRTRSEGFLAVAALVLGFLFWKLIIPSGLPSALLPVFYPFIMLTGALEASLGNLLFMGAFTLTLFGYMLLTRRRIAIDGALVWLGCLALSASFMLHTNQLIAGCSSALLTAGVGYALYLLFAPERGKGVIGTLRALFVTPFVCFNALFVVIRDGLRRTQWGKTIGKTLLGLAIALPLTALVTVLLMHSDDNFSALVTRILGNLGAGPLRTLGFVVLGLPMAMYFFAMIHGSTLSDRPSRSRTTDKPPFRQALHIAPASVIAMVVLPILMVYTIYFASQFTYFTNAFQGILPEGFIYSEYARRGFFELCAVAGINLAIMLGVMGLQKHSSKLSRTLCAVLCLYTLGLIAIALSKMAMYINTYGLTRLRVYTSWFMVVLTVLFILMLLKQLIQRLPICRIFVAVFLVLYAPLAFGRPDAAITQYNLARYQIDQGFNITAFLENDGQTVDAVALVKPLTQSDEKVVAAAAQRYLDKIGQQVIDHNPHWLYYNFGYTQAREALKNEDGSWAFDTPDPDRSRGSIRD